MISEKFKPGQQVYYVEGGGAKVGIVCSQEEAETCETYHQAISKEMGYEPVGEPVVWARWEGQLTNPNIPGLYAPESIVKLVQE